MATRWTKPVTRESAATDRGVPLIVTLHARHLEIRRKGTRQRYTVAYDVALWYAVKRDLDEKRRENAKARRGK